MTKIYYNKNLSEIQLINQQLSNLLGKERRWTTISAAWKLAERFRIGVRPTADGWIAAATTTIGTAYHKNPAMAICLVTLRIHDIEIATNEAQSQPPTQTPVSLGGTTQPQRVRCATYACSNWTDTVGPDHKPMCAECAKATKNAIWNTDASAMTSL